MITYLTQLTICWTILFLGYYVFLKRETFFAYNRWYLLIGLLLGLIIPLVDWTALIVHEAESIGHIYVAPVQAQVHQLDIYVATSEQTPWWYLLLSGIYTVGILVTGLKLLKGIREIMALRKGAEIIRKKGYDLVLTQEYHMPFSFMNAVYWSHDFYRESEEKDRILAHESKHISALHTLDILFLEVLCTVFWFHPLVYIYRKEIKEVHEYEADAAACLLGSKKEYGKLLLDQARSGLQLTLANHFVYSQLKNRFKMMTRNPSTKKAKLKYLLALPIIGLAGLIFSFAQSDNLPNQLSTLQQDTVIAPTPIPEMGDVIFLDEEKYVVKPTDLLYVNGQQIGFLTEELIQEYSQKGPWEFSIYTARAAKEKWGNNIDSYVYSLVKTEIAPGDQERRSTIQKTGEIFRVVEQMPRFPGCEEMAGTNRELKMCADKKMLEFLYKEVQYPQTARMNNIEGNVVVKFVVEKDGTISNPEVIREPGSGLGDEALRVVSQMNELPHRWTPGRQKGENVRVEFILPIKFQLKEEHKKPELISDNYHGEQLSKVTDKVFLIVDDEAVGVINPINLSNHITTNEIDGVSIHRRPEIIKQFQIEEKMSIFDVKSIAWVRKHPHKAESRRSSYTIVGKTITGKVEDQEGNPVVGANVVVKNSQMGTATDFNGEYRLFGVNNTDVLVVSHKGFDSREIEVRSNIENNVILYVPPVRIEEIYEDNEVTSMPRFPGCEDLKGSAKEKELCAQKKFLNYLYENIRYPASARKNKIQGQVIATFVVKADGTIDYVHILRDPGAGLGEEVERLLKNMNEVGKWTPAVKDEKPINIEMTMPVTFKLKGDDLIGEVKKVNLDKAVNPISEIVVVAFSESEAKSKKSEKDLKQINDKSALDEVGVSGSDQNTSKGESIDLLETTVLVVLNGNIIGRADGSRNLKHVDPSNIESINVLKGKEAIDKYGSQGKYGVAEITTKVPLWMQKSTNLHLSQFNLFPNPASHELTIGFQGPTGDYTLEVMDSKGAVLLKKDLYNQGQTQTVMNISKLNNGMYYLTIRSGNKASAKAFVKE